MFVPKIITQNRFFFSHGFYRKPVNNEFGLKHLGRVLSLRNVKENVVLSVFVLLINGRVIKTVKRPEFY